MYQEKDELYFAEIIFNLTNKEYVYDNKCTIIPH